MFGQPFPQNEAKTPKNLRGGEGGGGGRTLQGTAVEESFLVIDNVFVRDSNPNGNYDGVTNLGVAYGPTSNERITYVKFPISFDVRNALSISESSLHLCVNQAPATSTMTLNFSPCDTETWSEGSITWNTRPTYDNSTTTSALIATLVLEPVTSDNTWFAISVTSAVVAAVQANASTMSIVIEPDRPLNDPLASENMKLDSVFSVFLNPTL
mgnify:CR=1 FL=1